MSRRAKQSPSKRAPSIREKAYLHIQQMVAKGFLPAGSAISELQLASELGSSRTPIREAMNKLAAEGMLEQAPGGGMLVAHLKREDIIELYELREALEAYAVGRIASLSLAEEDRQRLQHSIDGITTLQKELARTRKPLLNDAQMQRFLAFDLEFHALLMSMTHNRRLQKVINDTRLLINVFAIRRRGHDQPTLREIQRYHQTIVDALAKQDAVVAVATISEHIRASQRERLSDYDYWRRESSLRHGVPLFARS